MRFTTHINNQRCLEWGLTANQGALFDFLNQASSWAKPVAYMGDVFYWVSKNKVIEELPLFYQKQDTVYRHFKVLEKKGLILHIKDGQKDLIKLTDKGRTWNEFSTDFNAEKLGLKSELGSRSEKTRIQIRKNSDLDPTDNNISINNININDKSGQARFVENFNSENLANYFLSKIKKLKPNFKQPNLATWSSQIDLICKADKKTLDEIKSIFDFAIQDEYWQQVMVSQSLPSKLRFNWDQLEFKAQHQQAPTSTNKPAAAEIFDERLPAFADLRDKYFKLRDKQEITEADYSSKFEYWLLRQIAREAELKIAADYEMDKIILRELRIFSKQLGQNIKVREIDNQRLNFWR